MNHGTSTPVVSCSDRRGAAVAILLVLLAGGCGNHGPARGPGALPVPVTIGAVERKTVVVSFRAVGHIEPIETVAVKARIGGQLLAVAFREGEKVRAGDALFLIDSREYEAALRQAEAQFARDQALLAKAEGDVTRYQGLVRQDFVTKEQFDQMIANAASLRAAVAADQAAIDSARLQVAYCRITAPIEGRTGTLSIKTGNLVKANDDRAMVTINRTRPIYASFAVPARHLDELLRRRAEGISVMAELAEGGAVAEGKLTFIDNMVDTATGTVLLKATFANQDERLWPGQFVDVTVVLGEEPDRVVAPAPAVQTGQQGQYVYVVMDDQTVELRPVRVNRMDEREAVIDEGLVGGEVVVTDGQLRLAPGARVEATPGEAPGNDRT